MLEEAVITSVFEARDTASGYELYRRHRPGVVIVDLAMHGGGLSGLPLIRRISAHNPSVRILVFSMHSEPIIVTQALQAGAIGYVLKDTSSEELMKAFEAVQAGKAYLSRELAVQVAMMQTPARQNPLDELTPRELQTLSLLAAGRPYDRVAQDLNVTYKTEVNVSYQLNGSWMRATCRN